MSAPPVRLPAGLEEVLPPCTVVQKIGAGILRLVEVSGRSGYNGYFVFVVTGGDDHPGRDVRQVWSPQTRH